MVLVFVELFQLNPHFLCLVFSWQHLVPYQDPSLIDSKFWFSFIMVDLYNLRSCGVYQSAVLEISAVCWICLRVSLLSWIFSSSLHECLLDVFKQRLFVFPLLIFYMFNAVSKVVLGKGFSLKQTCPL